MLRTYRWQIIALLVSVSMFSMVLIGRLTTTPTTAPSPTPAGENTTPPTETNAFTSTPIVETTPLPTTAPVDLLQPLDGVPTYREGLVGTVQRLNPLYADLNPVDRDITALIFRGLIKINEYGEPVGDLADSWVISNDGLEYVLTLRNDVLWQDGIPFSADDVLYTMSILHDPDFDGLAELGAFWRTVETEKLSSSIVRFRLTQPLASFLSSLTIGILPEHALRGTTASRLASHPFNLTPIGTGAYQLEALRTLDGTTISQVDLRVAPAFRQNVDGQRGYALERVSFQLYARYDDALNALVSGQIDGYASRNRTERAGLLAITTANAYTNIAPSVGMLIYNWDESDDTRFFQELRARVALQRGLNRVTPIEANLTNQVLIADSPILPNSWAYDATLQYPTTDIAQALDLLVNSNIKTATVSTDATLDPSQATTFYDFSILVNDDASIVNLANEFATQWSQLRLNVTVESVPSDVYQARLENGEFQAAIVELPLNADPDSFAYWHVGQAPDGKNYGALADDKLSELLERARRDASGINRILLYKQFQALFIERAVAIPLYYPLYTYTINQRIENVQLGFIGSPIDRFRTIGEWTIK